MSGIWNIKTSESFKINTSSCFAMRMFKSVSGHSGEQRAAHFSSTASCIAAKRCLRQLIWESATPGDKKLPPSLTLLSVQNSNRIINAIQADHNRKVFRAYLFNSCKIQGSAHCDALMRKTDLNFPLIVKRLDRETSSRNGFQHYGNSWLHYWKWYFLQHYTAQ